MSADDGRLALEVDATQPEKATRSLKEFTGASQGAEKAATSLGSTSKGTSRSIADMVASIERAVVGQTEFVRGLAEGAAAALKEEQQIRRTNAATDDMARRVAALKASVDPLGASIDKVNKELAEAADLYKAGAISADQLGRAQTVLAGRLGSLSAAHDKLAKGQKLSTAEAMNFGRQMADVGVMAAMGMNPLMILITQGPQIADIFATMRAKGVGFASTLKELGVAMGVLKVVQTEQAVANTATAATATAAAIAETALAEAEARTVVGAQAATAAAAEVSAANIAIAETATAAAAAESVALAPLAVILAGVAVAAGATAGAFALAVRAINKDAQSVQDSLGLTADQMEHLKKKGVDTSVTLGDTFMATAQVIGRHLMEGPIGDGIKWLQSAFGKAMDWITTKGLDAAISIASAWYAGWRTQIDVVKALPQAVAWAFTGAVNFAIDGINLMVKGALAGLNTLIGLINNIPGIKIGTVEWGGLSRVKQAAAPDFGPGFGAYYGQARDGLRAGAGEIADQARKNRDARAQKGLEDYHAKSGSKGKAGGASAAQDKAEQEAAEITRLIAQAKGDELQAQLALETDVRKRADIEKQVLGAEFAAKQADIDKKILEIQAAKHLSNKDELVAQLEAVKATYARVEDLKSQKIDRDRDLALLREATAMRETELEGQAGILRAQQDAAEWGFQRDRIGRQIADKEFDIYRLKLEEAIEQAKITERAAGINKISAERERLERELADATKANDIRKNKKTFEEQFPELAVFRETSEYFTGAIREITDALKAHDWLGAFRGLWNAIQKAREAWASGDKVGAVAGAANAVGQAVGGRAGAGISGAAQGAMAGFQVGGPVGAVIGGTLGFIGGIMGHDRAKKEAALQKALEEQEKMLSKAREIAADGVQRLKEAEEQRYGLLQRIYTATKDDAALQALTRKHELDGMDERTKALAEYTYALEDWRAGVDAAKTALQAAYDAEAGAYKDTISAVEAWIGTLKDLQRELLTGDLALNSPGAQYAKTRASYGSTFDLAFSGNQGARDDYSNVASQFLEASKASSRSMRDYQRDLALVKGNTKLLEETAGVQLTVAQQQLNALNAAVAGILTVNTSVLSVTAALANYQAAVASKPADRPDLMAEDPWKEGGAQWNAARARGQSDLAAGAWGDPNKWNGGNAVDMVLGNLRTSPDQVRAWYSDAKAKGSLLSVDAYLGLQAGTFAGFVRALNDPSMPVFATGGSFIVGGRSGTDQNVLSINGQAQARVSQGETIKVTAKGDPGSAAIVAAIQELSARMAKIERNTETTATRLTRASQGKDGFVMLKESA